MFSRELDKIGAQGIVPRWSSYTGHLGGGAQVVSFDAWVGFVFFFFCFLGLFEVELLWFDVFG